MHDTSISLRALSPPANWSPSAEESIFWDRTDYEEPRSNHYRAASGHAMDSFKDGMFSIPCGFGGLSLTLIYAAQKRRYTSDSLPSDGSCVLSGSDHKSVRVRDALMGDKKHGLNSHTSSVNSITFLSDGSCIISGPYDERVRVWDASTGKDIHVLHPSFWVNSVVYSSHGGYIISQVVSNSRTPEDSYTSSVGCPAPPDMVPSSYGMLQFSAADPSVDEARKKQKGIFSVSSRSGIDTLLFRVQ